MYNTHNEGPLTKKFICNYCGEAFRTRQGLSGHIQWKHGAKQKIQQIDSSYILSKGTKLDIIGKSIGLPKSTIQAWKRILANWLEVDQFCGILDIDLNKQDFKNYLITSLASVKQNEYLKEQLLTSIMALHQQ